MLNEMAHDSLKQGGHLDGEIAVETARGSRLMAPGERIVFLKNDRDLDVKNGTLATIERLDTARIEARLHAASCGARGSKVASARSSG